MDIGDPIKTTVEELMKIVAIENVIGDVIETDDKVIIPVTRIGIGFGAGMGEGSARKDMGKGAGGGAAAGAGVEPIAVIAIFKGVSGVEGVKVLPLSKPDHLSRAIKELGSVMIDMMSKWSTEKKEKKEKKEEEKKKEIKVT
jgi:uncharacterized spore protein YtfJ